MNPLDACVQGIQRDTTLNPAARARIAAALIEVTARRLDGRPVLAWQRLLDRTAVSVGVAR